MQEVEEEGGEGFDDVFHDTALSGLFDFSIFSFFSFFFFLTIPLPIKTQMMIPSPLPPPPQILYLLLSLNQRAGKPQHSKKLYGIQ